MTDSNALRKAHEKSPSTTHFFFQTGFSMALRTRERLSARFWGPSWARRWLVSSPRDVTRNGILWSHPPGSNWRPADYETRNRPASYSVLAVTHSPLLVSEVLPGGLWVGIWVGNIPRAFALPGSRRTTVDAVTSRSKLDRNTPNRRRGRRQQQRQTRLERSWRAAEVLAPTGIAARIKRANAPFQRHLRAVAGQ